jgi:hypothetical protein
VNQNYIVTDRFSDDASEQLYRAKWPDEPRLQRQYENGWQCELCSFYAQLNADYGLCCHPESRHCTETVWEHFTCPSFVLEGSGSHSFTKDSALHCRCNEDRDLFE